MKLRRPARVAALLALAVVAAVSPALSFELAGESDPPPAPGTPGVALTALEGSRVQEIPLTFLGVQEDALGPGYDLYLVRLEGTVAERVGVAAGMSGSPVLVDGKLIGALAYRLGVLPTEAVGGVTPIRDMLHARRPEPGGSGGGETVARIATPVQVGGLTGPVLAWLEPRLRDLGFVPVTGSAGGAAGPASLEPGGPIGVRLVGGDLNLGATGTVTWVDDGRVWAFGHSFFSDGSVELPMTTAEVVHTLADRAGSLKLARFGNDVGSIFEDRLSAVVGETGRLARTIPMSVDVSGAAYGEQSFHYELARHARLSPLLAAVVAANTLTLNLGHDPRATFRVSGAIRLDGAPDVALDLAATGGVPTDPAIQIAIALQRVLLLLWNNPFAEVHVLGIDLHVEVTPGVHSYRVDALHYDRGPLRPGDDLVVRCVLTTYRGERRTETFRLPVPSGLPASEPLMLAVGSPAEIEKALGQATADRVRSARSLDALAAALSGLRSPHRLTAVLLRRDGGVVSRGESYPGLPATAARLLSTRSASGAATPMLVVPLVRREIELDGPVEGGLGVRLRIDSGLEAEEEDD